jgi:hypothetical protein
MLMPLRWEAMTLRAGPGSAAHERRFGADIMGVFTAELRRYKTSKGFLAQAKRLEPCAPLSSGEWRRLQSQCDKMLAITPDAFLIAYSSVRGVRFISARAVTDYIGRDAFDLYDISVMFFFEKHFESFIGDSRLDKPDIRTLENLYIEMPADERPSVHVCS